MCRIVCACILNRLMAHWNVQYDWENPNTNILLIKIHAVHIIYNTLYDEIHVTLNSPNNIYIYMCQYIADDAVKTACTDEDIYWSPSSQEEEIYICTNVASQVPRDPEGQSEDVDQAGGDL